MMNVVAAIIFAIMVIERRPWCRKQTVGENEENDAG